MLSFGSFAEALKQPAPVRQLNGLRSVPLPPAAAEAFTNQSIPLTVTVAVPFVVATPSVAVYVNVSAPSKPAGGLYVKLPSAAITTLLVHGAVQFVLDFV